MKNRKQALTWALLVAVGLMIVSNWYDWSMQMTRWWIALNQWVQ